MDNRELLNLINLLRDESDKDKLVVFVGAGVSCNVPGMPNWNDLIVKMAEAIGYSKCTECRHEWKCDDKDKCLTKDDFSADDYLKIPQYVYNQDKDTYNRIIRENISNQKVSDAPLSKAIFDLKPSHIITTNYDTLIESSESEYCDQYGVIIYDKDLLNAEKKKYIIKMHGDVSDLDTIVLKEQDYLNFSQTHVLIELFVKALLTDHTFLFLGYSLNDYNVKLILSWINYIRSQNEKVLSKNIGYIVLDEEEVDKNKMHYFSQHNIAVINIHDLSQIEDIPSSLSDDRGKRLLSFLKIISNPSLEESSFSTVWLEREVDFLTRFPIYDSSILMKYLNIETKGYSITDTTLRLFSKHQYQRLTAFMDGKTEKSKRLKQIFVDANIRFLVYVENFKELSYTIDKEYNHRLLNDEFFVLYIQNKYDELLTLCQQGTNEILKSTFYQHFLTGYVGINEKLSSVCFETLSSVYKVSFLFNKAIINAIYTFKFDSSKVKQYINNISSYKERLAFQSYLDIFEGNASRLSKMLKSLTTLKNNIRNSHNTIFSNGSVAEIYNIKKYVIAQYFFYYCNGLFVNGFSDTKDFFRPYIEAIIWANTEQATNSSNYSGLCSNNKKYLITEIDFDILSKFINTKDLYNLIITNNIVSLYTKDTTIDHLVSCVENLINSLISKKTYGFKNSSIAVLTNLMLLLSKLTLNDSHKSGLLKAIENIFADDAFNENFWTVVCPNFGINVKVIASIMDQLPAATNIKCVQSILLSPNFFEFYINADSMAVKKIVRHFLEEEDYDLYKENLFNLIDDKTEFREKIIMIRLFYGLIKDSDKKEEYHDFVSKNFSRLRIEEIYDFVLHDWVTPSEEDTDELINKTLVAYQNQRPGVYSYPDPVESKLACIYLLFLSENIKELSKLDDLCTDHPHLHFLLHPNEFDYTKVDFSDCMWENFARHQEYMDLFVEHKDEIIPLIQERMKIGDAKEIEKAIYYGFFKVGNQIWETI